MSLHILEKAISVLQPLMGPFFSSLFTPRNYFLPMRLIRNYLSYCSLRIAFQSETRLSSPFCFEDIVPKVISSHLVYKFMCSCYNTTYYGESEKCFFITAPGSFLAGYYVQ